MADSLETVQWLVERADSFREKKQWEDAADVYTDALLAAEKNAETSSATKVAIYHGRGIAYREMKSHDAALTDFQSALDLDANCARLYCDRGEALLGVGNYDRAMDDFEKTLEMLPNDPDALSGRGAVYFKRKDYKNALVQCNLAIKASATKGATRDNAILYTNRGMVYAARGLHNHASRDFHRALKADPEFKEAKFELERSQLLLKHRRELSRLRAAYKKFLNLDDYTSREEEYRRDAEAVATSIWIRMIFLKVYSFGLLALILGILGIHVGVFGAHSGEWLQLDPEFNPLVIFPIITAIAGICSFPLLWDIRFLEKKQVRLLALSQDAYTKGELVTLVNTDEHTGPKSELQKNLLLKLFDNHAEHGSAQLIIDLENNTKSDSSTANLFVQQLKDKLPAKDND